jgi:hypothetical protein
MRAASGGKRPPAERRVRLSVERLEARQLLTVFFTPRFPGERIDVNMKDNKFIGWSGQELTQPTLGPNTPVYLLFADNPAWGWDQHADDIKALVQAAQDIVGGPFLSGLTTYGYQGGAYIADGSSPWVYDQTQPSFTNDKEAFPTSPLGDDLANELFGPNGNDGAISAVTKNNLPPAGTTEFNTPLYVIVAPPGEHVLPYNDPNGVNGVNSFGPVVNGKYLGAIACVETGYVQTILSNGMVESRLDKDGFTDLFSHELVEAMSHQLQVEFPAALKNTQATLGGFSRGQIGDGEPNGRRYTARLSTGELVQAYWWEPDPFNFPQIGSFVVPDGNSQTIINKADWSTPTSGQPSRWLSNTEVPTGLQVTGFQGTRLAPLPLDQQGVLPAVNTVEFNNRFYRTSTDSDGNIWIAMSPDSPTDDYGPNVEIAAPQTYHSTYASLAVFNDPVSGSSDDLYIAFTRGDNQHVDVGIVNLDPLTGEPTNTIRDLREDGGSTSSSQPGLASYDNALFLAFSGTSNKDHPLWLDYITDPTEPWGEHVTDSYNQSNDAVRLVDDKVNDRLVIAWTGVDDNSPRFAQVKLNTAEAPPLVSLPAVTGALTVDGYQYVGMDDNITVDRSPAGGGRVTLNGVVRDYALGSISDLVIDTGPGTNTVSLLATPANGPVTINALGRTTVNLGNAGRIAIGGDVTIWGAYHSVDLTLDDSADPWSGGIDLFSSEGVDRLNGRLFGTSTLRFGHSDLSQFTLKAGYGQNSVTLGDTPDTRDSMHLELGGAPNLDRDGAVKDNNVYVAGTTGNLYISGSSAHDVVTVFPVGDDDIPPRVSTINGFVNVSNATGSTALIVDASNDAADLPNARLDAGRLTGLTAADIIWQPGSGPTGVTSVEVRGGSGADTYSVVNTSVLSGGPTRLETGKGTNTVNIEKTVGDLRLDLGRGTDTVDVSPTTRNLSNIRGNVTVTGSGGDALLRIDDQQGTGIPWNLPLGATSLQSRMSYTVTGQDVSRSISFTYSTSNSGGSGVAFTDVRYAGITTLELNGSNVGAAYGITDTTAATAVNGGIGHDTFTVSNSLDSIGQLTVNGNGGADTLKIDDSLGTGFPPTLPPGVTVATSRMSYTVTGHDVSRSAGYGYPTPDGGGGGASLAVIGYQSIGTLELDGSVVGAIHVESTTVPTTVKAGAGTVVINVGDSANRLDGIQAALTVNGQAGAGTTLTINDQGTTTDQVYEIFATEVDRTHLPDAQGHYLPDIASITYANITGLALDAGSGYNLLYVESTAASTRTTDVYGGAGTDVFGLGVLDGIQGPVALHGRSGPGGVSYAMFNDANVTSVKQTYTLNSGALNRTGIAAITYDGLVEDVLYTSEFTGAVVNVQSNAANVSTIIVGGGGDPVTVGSLAPALGGTLDNIRGTLVLTSGHLGQIPSIVIDDSADKYDHPAVSLSPYPPYYGYEMTGLAPAQLFFGLDRAIPVSILGGQGNDTFTVAGPIAAAAITIDGGGGSNTLVGPNTANTWAIKGQNSGMLNAIAFRNFQNLVGGGTSDVFRFNPAGASIGTIKGGTGAATLDYSLFTTGVSVNLSDGTNGTASDVGRTVSGITAMIGGSGNDTLNAGSVPNVALTGGLGTNSLSGTGAGDSVVESMASSYTLASTRLTGTGAGFVDNLSGIDVAHLTGSSSVSNAFTVSAWTGSGSLTAPAGTGTVTASKRAGFTLANNALSSSDGMELGLSGITRANLTTSATSGSPSAIVDASGFTGITNLTAAGTVNAILFGGSGNGSTLSATGSGNDVLIGGSGQDTLIDTGSGSNILIGGAGADTIRGNGHDILISGTTRYDRNTSANIAALDAILAEWSSSDSYALRISKISSGVGPRGAFALNASTCQSDGVSNSVSDGTSPVQNNWFIVNTKDVVSKKKSETETIV